MKGMSPAVNGEHKLAMKAYEDSATLCPITSSSLSGNITMFPTAPIACVLMTEKICAAQAGGTRSVRGGLS